MERNTCGSALPAALFLLAMLALVGAALHLAVATEGQLSVNCLEADRARLAAGSAARRRSAELRRALARFRLPAGTGEAEATAYRDDLAAGGLGLLEDGIPGLVSVFGPWTLDLPLDHEPLAPLDDLADSRAACHIEPVSVAGASATGLLFTYRCRITGEGRSSRPRRYGVAYSREEIIFTLSLARFPLCHWQLGLPGGGETAGDPQLHLPPLRFGGPVAISGRPGFRGTGVPRSGLPRFDGPLLTPLDDPAGWDLVDAADPTFALGLACRVAPFPPCAPPVELVRAALGSDPPGSPLPAGVHLLSGGSLTGGIYVSGDLDRLEVRGEGGEQVFVLAPAGGLPPVEVRVDSDSDVTRVDGVSWPGLITGPMYVEGSINRLDTGAPSGSPVPAALAPGSGVTVAASGAIVITGHLPAEASLLPHPEPRVSAPADGRVLGIFSTGLRADGSSGGAGQGIVLNWPEAATLCLDAVLAVGDEGRGLHWGSPGGTAAIFGALLVESLVQPELFSRLEVTYDPRLRNPAFQTPAWPRPPAFEAYLSSWESVRRDEISPYD